MKTTPKRVAAPFSLALVRPRIRNPALDSPTRRAAAMRRREPGEGGVRNRPPVQFLSSLSTLYSSFCPLLSPLFLLPSPPSIHHPSTTIHQPAMNPGPTPTVEKTNHIH